MLSEPDRSSNQQIPPRPGTGLNQTRTCKKTSQPKTQKNIPSLKKNTFICIHMNPYHLYTNKQRFSRIQTIYTQISRGSPLYSKKGCTTKITLIAIHLRTEITSKDRPQMASSIQEKSCYNEYLHIIKIFRIFVINITP